MNYVRSLLAMAVLISSHAVYADSITFSNLPGIAKPFGYSHVVNVPAGKRMVFISGQSGFLPDGTLAGKAGDFKAQASQAFKNVEIALQSVGASWDDVVKINMYMTDIKTQIPLLREVRDGLVNTASPPASTTVEISHLVTDGALFEIEAVAMLLQG